MKLNKLSRASLLLAIVLSVVVSIAIGIADHNNAAAGRTSDSEIDHFCATVTKYGFYEHMYIGDGSDNIVLIVPPGETEVSINFQVELFFCKERTYGLKSHDYRIVDTKDGHNRLLWAAQTETTTYPTDSVLRNTPAGHKEMASYPIQGTLDVSGIPDGETITLYTYVEATTFDPVGWVEPAEPHEIEVTVIYQKAWSVVEDGSYIQRIDNSSNPVGSPLGTTVIAKPGERYGFFPRWRNDGPDVTDKEIEFLRANNYPSPRSSSSMAYWRSVDAGVLKDGSFIESGTQAGHTGLITQDDVGKTFTFQTAASPRSWNSGGRVNGEILTVEVPYNYELTPVVGDPTVDAAEPGSGVTVSVSRVDNSGPTKSRPAEWQLTQFIVPSGSGVPSGGASGAVPCAFYAGSDCQPVRSGDDLDIGPSGETIDESLYDLDPVPDLAVGSKICFAFSVKDRAHDDNRWQHSDPKCVVVGKRPKVQVHGGDLAARGIVATSTSIKSGIEYGSWGEYSALARGLLTGFRSASELAEPSPASGLNRLTFTNHNSSGLGSFTGTGYWARPMSAMSDRLGSLSAGTASLPGGSISSWNSGTYRVGSASIPGGVIPAGKSIIVVAEGTININSDISYTTGSLSSFNDIPQLVIIANNINIAGSVGRVDAWLLAPNGSINTCSDVGPTDNLTHGMCNNVLNVNGPVVTDKLYLRRTAGSGTGDASGDPAEIFNLRADAYIWAHLNAGGSGRAQTVFMTEKAPRY